MIANRVCYLGYYVVNKGDFLYLLHLANRECEGYFLGNKIVPPLFPSPALSASFHQQMKHQETSATCMYRYSWIVCLCMCLCMLNLLYLHTICSLFQGSERSTFIARVWSVGISMDSPAFLPFLLGQWPHLCPELNWSITPTGQLSDSAELSGLSLECLATSLRTGFMTTTHWNEDEELMFDMCKLPAKVSWPTNLTTGRHSYSLLFWIFLQEALYKVLSDRSLCWCSWNWYWFGYTIGHLWRWSLIVSPWLVGRNSHSYTLCAYCRSQPVPTSHISFYNEVEVLWCGFSFW